MTKKDKIETVMADLERDEQAMYLYSRLAVMALIVFTIIAAVCSNFVWMLIGVMGAMVALFILAAIAVSYTRKAAKLLSVCEVVLEYDSDDTEYIQKAIKILGL